jgi:hypothetical protein
MMGMISGMAKRKRRGVPLTALTPQARAAGNIGLDDMQQQIIAAWLSLPKAAQRQAVVDAMQDGRDELLMEDLPGSAGEAAEPAAEEAAEAPPTGGGGAVVVEDGQWSPEEEEVPPQPGAGPEWNT